MVTLYKGTLKPGQYTFDFYGQDYRDEFKASGVYFFRCYADGEMILQRKCVILK